MKVSLRSTVTLLLIAALVCGIAAAAFAVQVVSEVRAYAIADWTLYGRTASGEPLSFNPYYAQSGTAWVPSGPAKNVFPALESGETVKVTWTLDGEGRRRVDAIQITSALTGITKATVDSVNATGGVLVVRPKDEPGTVTMNTKFVLVERRYVPDPVIVKKLSTLTKGAKIKVSWAWDNEGRKRITDIIIGW